MVSNRQGVKLPEGLGGVVTGLCKLTAKTANNNIDYITSKRLGVIVHIGTCTLTGTRQRLHVSKISGCRFKPCRALSRAVSSAVKAEGGYSRYIVFPTKQHVSELFHKPRISRVSRKDIRNEEVRRHLLSNYDEFRME